MDSTRRAIASLLADNFSAHCNHRALDFYLKEELYDCNFLVENATKDERKLFRCHKLILAIASPVFEAMLWGSFSEGSKGPDDPIRISEVSPDCFDLAMRFVYGRGSVEFASLAHAIEVFTFAHQWQIEFLGKIAAAEFSKYDTSGGGDLQLYEMFKLLNDEIKTREYFQKVAQQCDAVIASEDWLLASKESVMEILSANWLKVRDESALFAAMVAWGEHQVKSRGDEESYEATRLELTDLLPLIRFRTLTAAQFAELSDLSCSKILSDNEKLALFRSLSTDKESQMPAGFSLQTESRQSDELALLRTHTIEFKPRVNRPRPLDDDHDPLETRFSISALDSDIGVCYYLCGVSLYSLDYMNEGRPVDVKFYLRHGQSVLGSGSFAVGANEVRGADAPAQLFDRPVLLSSGLTYVISVKHAARPWTVANLMNEGKYCFCANVNGDLVQVGRMGDVYRMVMKYAGMLEQEYATLDVSRSESVLMPSN